MRNLSLLLILVMAVNSAMTQNHYVTGSKDLKGRVLAEKQISPDGKIPIATPFIPGQKSRSITAIGQTWYDTQTYNSGNEMNRIYEYPDGTIGATWIGKGESGVPDRGTGYNYFDGTSWTGEVDHLGGDPNNGFPSYAPWGANGEVVAHYQYIANTGPIKILRRDNKGTGTWQESVLSPPAGNHSLVWHSMITSGQNHEYLHLLALVYDDPYMGQDDALLYYRSPDGGQTWDINGVIIDGLGVDHFLTIPGLKYSWAQPLGDTIAFCFGFDSYDGLVFKSTDNGTTWQKIVVYQSPFTPFNVPDLSPEYAGGDGSSAIALDSHGKVHVVFGRMNHIHDVVTTPPGGWYFYPATEGLIYWNEDMPPLDSTIISSFTLDSLAAHGNLIGWVYPPDTGLVIPSGQPNYGVGLTTGPQIGVDADDKLFVVWAALAPQYSDGTYFYRHLYGTSSYDGGITWNGIRDLNTDPVFAFSECVFPAVAPIVGQKIQVVFQEDDIPGTGAGNKNFIDHMDFDKDYFVGVPAAPQPAGFSVTQNYPNPVINSTRIGVRLEQVAAVSLTVTNLAGQVVMQRDMGRMSSGNNYITMDLSGLAGGFYFYTVRVNDQSVTHKMILDE
ncbi:MAG: T9SS type A sorting domain-containing protein [Bacteroidetes bacterium]|nr:T9SS type A sorting domain-containing protein [Bacteroidota bacterium]